MNSRKKSSRIGSPVQYYPWRAVTGLSNWGHGLDLLPLPTVGGAEGREINRGYLTAIKTFFATPTLRAVAKTVFDFDWTRLPHNLD